MSRAVRWFTTARVRRVVQILLLAVFFALILLTRFQATPVITSTDGKVVSSPALQAPAPLLKLFFIIDPLITAVTALAAHSVPKIALWSLLTIAVTVLLGRVFCGWICPMGTIHAIAGRLFRRRNSRKGFGDWSPWQLTKYYLLLGLLVGAIFGLHWVCILDPIVWLTRTTSTALVPATQWAAKESSTAIYQSDPGAGPVRLDKVVEPAYRFVNKYMFGLEGSDHDPVYLGGGLILVLFVIMVALNAWRPRFWCRYLCPLGAFLGIFSWRPLLRRKVNAETCNQCDLCGMSCHGAAAIGPGGVWKPMECLGCMDCSESCRRGSLKFQFVLPWRKEPKIGSIDLGRRGMMAAAIGGIVTLAAMRVSPQARGRTFNPILIRPPGARPERGFLERCTSCGLCMKVCPTGGLQPTLTEAGLEGLWTPMLVPQIGYCDYMCNLCGQVCPTEAIVPLSLDEKHATKLGLAAFDVTRCIPYAYGRECMVCEEHCPIPDKAIYCLEVEIRDRNGEKKTIKRPYVDPEKCIGCGVCEHVCPYKDRPAIRVTSANETRHAENQPILGSGGDYPSA
jgi:polyferredoxin/formate hydrogenlyase subunit 6/NADH:ubiquinone oxidoreductase subunit I